MDNFINQNSEKKLREKGINVSEEITWSSPQFGGFPSDSDITDPQTSQDSDQIMQNASDVSQDSDDISPEDVEKAVNLMNTIKRYILGGFLILPGVIFFLIGVCVTISDANKSKEYESTKCYYYDKEYSSLGGYEGKYSFEVGGKTYYVEYAKIQSDPKDFPEEMTVLYDPTDPNNAVIKSAIWIKFAIMGCIVMMSGIVVIMWKKISKLFHLENKVRMRMR